MSDRYSRVCHVFPYPRAASIRLVYVIRSLLGPLRSCTGFKVYVLTSWCKWVRYPAPRPSPQPLHRRAICAAKSGNSAPRTKHLENQLDLFLHGQAECQTTQGFLAHNVFLHHLFFYFRFFSFFFSLNRAERCTKETLLLRTLIILIIILLLSLLSWV